MNLDPFGPAPDDPSVLAPPEWTMEVHREGNMYTAEVKRGREIMCRVSIASNVGDESAAQTALAKKARLWIRDFVSRSEQP